MSSVAVLVNHVKIVLSYFGLVSECRLAPRAEETGLRVNEAKV